MGVNKNNARKKGTVKEFRADEMYCIHCTVWVPAISQLRKLPQCHKQHRLVSDER